VFFLILVAYLYVSPPWSVGVLTILFTHTQLLDIMVWGGAAWDKNIASAYAELAGVASFIMPPLRCALEEGTEVGGEFAYRFIVPFLLSIVVVLIYYLYYFTIGKNSAPPAMEGGDTGNEMNGRNESSTENSNLKGILYIYIFINIIINIYIIIINKKRIWKCNCFFILISTYFKK
jgi:hypothetical protein